MYGLSFNLVWITPALTERTKSIEVVKMESDTMGAKRASDDEPTLTPDYASVQRFVIQTAE